MQKVVSSGMKAKRRTIDSFTLIELLTVIAIIAILATLILAAAGGLETAAARKRAMSEISGMSGALENYKNDNGIFPPGGSAGSVLLGPPNPGNYTTDPTSITYQQASSYLYQALSGQTNFTDVPPPTGIKSYYAFTKKQVFFSGNGSFANGGNTYVQDPWGFSYGYSTGDGNLQGNPPSPQVQYPFNGSGFFDLWSTGGTGAAGAVGPAVANTNTWISNWQ
jgi:prepilin-type N-terminal cleavage/methylation domain-containing protein